MQIKIGEKIKELRARDGRTQNDLATAIGVSCQAVSRWEANGGYPDMEIIPAIANYFHVTIDELYGYHGDREERIADILKEANKILLKYSHFGKGELSEDVKDCIQLLRTAADEFPNESKILLKLATALHMWGWHKHGMQACPPDSSGFIHFDIEQNSKNVYWQEAVQALEKALGANPSPEDRESIIQQLTPLYCRMGEYEKAKALACDQNALIICKEVLLPMATTGDEQQRYQAERVMALLSRLELSITESMAYRPAVSCSEYGQNIRLSVAKLYESIFADGKFGKYHGVMGRLYLDLSFNECISLHNTEQALIYFERAFDHYKQSIRVYNEGNYDYTAPLLSGMKSLKKGDYAPVDMGDFWKKELKTYPQAFRDELRQNSKYAECFAE